MLAGAPVIGFSLYIFQTFCAPFQVLVQVSIVANNAILSLCTQRPTFFRKVRRLATGELQHTFGHANSHPHRKGKSGGKSPLVAEAYGAACRRVLHLCEEKYNKHKPPRYMEGM